MLRTLHLSTSIRSTFVRPATVNAIRFASSGKAGTEDIPNSAVPRAQGVKEAVKEAGKAAKETVKSDQKAAGKETAQNQGLGDGRDIQQIEKDRGMEVAKEKNTKSG